MLEGEGVLDPRYNQDMHVPSVANSPSLSPSAKVRLTACAITAPWPAFTALARDAAAIVALPSAK